MPPFSLLMALFCVPGSGLVEPRRPDVRAADRRIALHRGRGQQLAHGHRKVKLLPDRSFALFRSYDTSDLICLTRRRRILKKDPPFPKDLGPLAKDLIQRLLVKDPKKRLGSGPGGAENVKKRPFYQVQPAVCLKQVVPTRLIRTPRRFLLVLENQLGGPGG